MRDHIIVCGMGHVGYQVVRLLIGLDERVTVVTDRCRDDWRSDVESRGVAVHIGDARSGELLRKAGLLDARALIAVTDRDLINIEVAGEKHLSLVTRPLQEWS
ncbi:MAG TPA: NAD-binding protein [Thermoanaerobaculia bacterium]|nr:NAD-binding protein [Thermoanaerobaculia bacterium]